MGRGQQIINKSVSQLSLGIQQNPKSTLHSGQGSIDTRTATTKTSGGQIDQTSSLIHLSEFKLLIKIMRLWRVHTRQNLERRKVEKHRFIENLAVSIHYHEQTLLNKTMLGFQQWKNTSKRWKLVLRVSKRRHENRVKKACLLTLSAFSYRLKLKKEMVFKALYHWSQNQLSKLFSSWRHTLKRLKSERDRLFLRLLHHPLAIRCLMSLANFDLSTLLMRKGIEDSVDQRMIRVSLSRFYQGAIFKGFKALVYRDGVKIGKWHDRYVFRVLARQLIKKARLRRNLQQQQMQSAATYKLSTFRKWLLATKQKLLFIRLESESEMHRDRVLKYKVVRSFLMNLQDLKLRKSQLQASVNTKLNKVIQTAFQGWQFVTLFHRKHRSISQSFRKQLQLKSKVKHFFLWVETAILHQRARVHHDSSLQKKSFGSIFAYIKQREIKLERLQSLRDYRCLQLQRSVFTLWGIISVRCQKERHLRRHVFRWAKTARLRRCMVGWRKAILDKRDQEQRHGHIRDYMEKRKMILVIACIRECALYQKEMREAYEVVSAHNAKRVQLSVLRLWNYNYVKLLDTKGKTDTLASRSRQQVLHSHLSQWYLLTNLRIQRKLSLKKLRIKNRLQLCFTQIKAHAQERSTFRARLHRFLKLRATFLLTRSFTGLTTFTRERLLNIKLNKVSRYVHLRRLLLSSFSHLKTFHQRIRAYKLVNCKTKLKLAHSTLNRWKTEYLRTDIGKKLSTRRETVKTFKCLLMLRAKTKEMKRLRLIGGKISGKKSVQRKVKALKAWYLQKLMQQKHKALKQLSLKYNHKRLSKVAFNHITLYASLKKQKKLQRKAMVEARQSKLVYAFYSTLKQKVVKTKTYKVLAQPLRENYKRSIVRKALCALYSYGYSKYVLEVKGQRAEKVHQRRLKEKAYSSLMDEVIESKQSLVQHQIARAFDQQRVMRKALFSFLKYKILNRYARDVIKGQQLTQMHRFMSVWYELYVDCQGQKALFEIAENHYLQKVFSKFLSAYHVFKLEESVKRAKRLRALALYSKSLATYAFGVFKLFLAGCREKRLQLVMAKQQRASTLFNAWQSIRVQLQSENLKRKLSQGFRRQHILSQSFIHLALIVNDKKRQALKIEYMRSVWANNTKKHAMHALFENIGRQQKIREFFTGKKDTFSRILMRSALLQWHSKLMTLNLEDTALWFRNVLWPKTILRRCMRSFSAFTIRSQALSSAFTTINKRTRTSLKATYTVHWLLAAARSRALRARLDAFSQKHHEQSLGRVFFALQRAVIVKKTVRNHGEQAEIVRHSTLARKALVALQRNQCVQQTAKYVCEKVAAERILKVFSQWRREMQVKTAGSRLADLLDRLKIKSQAQSFLRKLAKHSVTQRTTQYIQGQHVLRRCLLFFDLLRTRMIYKRIVQSCQFAKDLHDKRQIFNAFKVFAQLRVQHHSILELQVETLLGETNREVAACAFASLQINARQGRLKRVANYRYRQSLLRKGILSLAIVAQKLKICKYGRIELEIKRKARFFVLWYEAIAAQRTASVARKVLRINKQSRIIDQWRAVVCRDRMAGAHHYNNCQKSMLPQAFEALKAYSQKKRYFRFCQHEISQNREFVLIKEVMLAWLQYHNMKRIQFNMQRFYQFKIVKNIIDSWRLIQIQNSYKRRCRLHIRETLRSRPELARPLFALRSQKLYQAFHAFRLGINNAKRLKEIESYSSYVFYIRMLQRGFEGLRLSAIKRQQKRNVVVISEMLVLRRWFAELREAVRVKKWGKQARIESAIFNFLSIQRKGFNSLLEYAQIKKQERLKLMLATDIYAKSLIIKAFSALRQAVLDRPQVSGEGTGYLIQCDIAQFDHHGSFAPLSSTSQPMKYSFDHTYSGGFEANKSHLLNPTMIYNDRSNLYSTALHEGCQGTNTNSTSNNNTMILIHGGPTQELEFSQGEEDRETMADELYVKKRLYQCFIGWLSTLGEVEQ